MKTLAENRRARFDYEILETYEAGIVLTGQEVKSVKNGRAQIAGSYAVVRHGEPRLLNANIPPYQPKNAPGSYDPSRSRQLLLHKKEVQNLIGKLHEKGLTLVPLKMYLKKNLIKVEIALARPRKKHDKRELLRRRAHEQEMKRA